MSILEQARKLLDETPETITGPPGSPLVLSYIFAKAVLEACEIIDKHTDCLDSDDTCYYCPINDSCKFQVGKAATFLEKMKETK
jgi:hypothetical protein